MVHSACTQERDGTRAVLAPLVNRFSKLRKIWADSIYNSGIAEWVRDLRQRNRIALELVKRPADAQGFLVLANRWVVERTFAWLAKRRSIDTRWCKKPQNWLAFVHMACAQILLNIIFLG